MGYPVFLSTFIGRRSELSEIETLLREKSTRLLTLTGPGGCGKTRLAFELSSQLSGAFEDGIAWVDLVGLALPEALPQAIAAALEIRPAPGQSMQSALTTALQPRETLLVIDNCEHIIEACARLMDDLLRACPTLHCLATSRQKLGVEYETLWPVPPLSYPSNDNLPPKSLAHYDAVQLFTARARLVLPKFEVEAQNAPALVKIARLLDGMPLAIELAAARVDQLNVPQLAERLENQLAFLAGQEHAADARHQSMHATIDWSHELLSNAEKTLFHRLGIFAGGFTNEAVKEVCSLAPLAEAQIPGLLAKLIDKSLVIRERGREGDARYRMLESIRQYAEEKLQNSGEERLLRDQHLAYFADLCHEAETRLLGPDQRIWTEILDADHENLRSALSWAFHKTRVEEGYPQETVKLINDLYWYWNNTERYEEARGWYTQALELPGLELNSPAHADLFHNLATFTWLLGDYPAAQTQLRRGLEIAQSEDYAKGIGYTKLMLGVMFLHQGRTEQAIGLLKDSEGVFQALDDPRGLGITYANLGGVFLEIGDLEAAEGYAKKAVSLARASQDLWGLGLSLSGLGDVLYRQGEVKTGLRLMEEALEVLQRTGQNWLRAEALWRLAEMQRDQGELKRAKIQLESCYELAMDSGAKEWQLSALESLGFLSLTQGNDRQAAGHFAEILRSTDGESYENVRLHVFLGVVQLAISARQWERAACLWGAYEGLKASQGPPPFREENTTLELLQPYLAKPSNSIAWQSGKAYSLEEATSLALEITKGYTHRVTAVPSEYVLRLLALGPTEVYLKGQLLVPADWTFAKPKELLYYLVSNQPKTKDQIGLVFWPDASPSQLRASLRAALYHARRALGGREWILYEDGFYQFNRSMNYWYDVEAFEEGLNFAQALVEHAPLQAIEKLEAVVDLYRGDFLADIEQDDWATLRREELKRSYLAALNTLGNLLVESNASDRAIEIFHRLLTADNLVEEAHRALMRCYALQGERVLALRQYRTLVEILQNELGVQPSPETTGLYRSLQSDGP